MKKFLTPLFYSAAVLLAACGNDKIDIAKNSEAVSPIVVPDNPTKCEEFAAKELKWHLDKMSGGDFKILKESESGNADGAIYVGNGKTAKIPSSLLPQRVLYYPATGAISLSKRL